MDLKRDSYILDTLYRPLYFININFIMYLPDAIEFDCFLHTHYHDYVIYTYYVHVASYLLLTKLVH